MNHKLKLWGGLVLVGLLVLSATILLSSRKAAPTEPLSPATPQIGDRLAEPPLPANPTEYEWGRYLYWLNCMPCHGDRGQGLTAEFRSLYVEDQNCWARGCHAGHVGDQGFPIPLTVPAIISANGTLPPFATADALFKYLRTTHPPQHPGILPDDQYWAISDYLLVQNKRLSPGQVLGPGAQTMGHKEFWRFATVGVLLLLAVVVVVWLAWRRKPGQKSISSPPIL
jgi:mono/diheme cytochrome c family protein